MVFQQVRHKKVYNEVFIQLQELFEKGIFKPGDRLPSERELAEMINVSRNSLREAFKVLEILGLIDIIPGSGTYVKKTKDDIILPLAISLSVEQNSMIELMETRQILETQCAKLAAERADDTDLEKMQHILLEMERSINSPKGWIQADIHFHYLVAKAAKNKLCLRLLLTLTEHIFETLTVVRARRFTNNERAQATVLEHIEIFKAIQAKDARLAAILMDQHIAKAAAEIKV